MRLSQAARCLLTSAMSSTAPTKPAGSGPSLLDLPNEVLLECLLPALEAQDIAAVSQTNHQLHALAVSCIVPIDCAWAVLTDRSGG